MLDFAQTERVRSNRRDTFVERSGENDIVNSIHLSPQRAFVNPLKLNFKGFTQSTVFEKSGSLNLGKTEIDQSIDIGTIITQKEEDIKDLRMKLKANKKSLAKCQEEKRDLESHQKKISNLNDQNKKTIHNQELIIQDLEKKIFEIRLDQMNKMNNEIEKRKIQKKENGDNKTKKKLKKLLMILKE